MVLTLYSLVALDVRSCSDDDTLKVWDARTRTVLETLKGHTASVSSVAFRSDGSNIVSGSSLAVLLCK
jgi:WD40 repeat protein